MIDFQDNFLLWLAVTAVAAAVAFGGTIAALRFGEHLMRRGPFTRDLIHRTRGPARLVVVLLALLLMEQAAPVEAGIKSILRHATALALMAAVAWLLVVVAFVVQDLALHRYRVDVPDNLRARKIHTQVTVLRRITIFAVMVITVGAMLMTFARVRALGASILASAGVFGLVMGVAARSALGNLVAGVQIAFTEPIKLDDVVVIQGEWGRVEEITLTYVIVRLWDQRRMVLPISYFMSNPFENWTRRTAQLLPTVEFQVDYSVPVDEVRAELHRILEATDLWDGTTWTLQAVDAGERTMKLRALMSAKDAPTAWNLRCEVREKLIAWLQRTHPTALPRQRAELVAGGGGHSWSAPVVATDRHVGTGDRFPWRPRTYQAH